MLFLPCVAVWLLQLGVSCCLGKKDLAYVILAHLYVYFACINIFRFSLSHGLDVACYNLVKIKVTISKISLIKYSLFSFASPEYISYLKAFMI